ncbi:Protein similar to cobyrinic acid a,c-diamide synthetase clustered with dissimilatory sulfite reductase [hydrothermal vent metagenome]|uniref:Protein similar to cobyrinic acid a,c-diamide synthetase clustered with dissimilatory sulfite reductase n=1 Tax=hydrothermal vent metagenome TaxID=652676 RepID=A0A3B0ZCL2_9ZZZZ
MSRLFISAAHKSSGKTTLSIGLCAALHAKGLSVTPFKKGPDYIDPMWLSRAAHNPCTNLDFYTMQHDEILQSIATAEQNSDITLIEGNKGLYDGLDLDGSNSNAALAILSKTPVVLVINVQGMTRGIAPLILGYQAFEKDIHIAGVILNQYRGLRHEEKLKAVIEHYTDVPVIGAVQHNPELEITERHLGLVPSNESQLAENKIEQIRQHVSNQVDIDAIIDIARKPQKLEVATSPTIHIQPVKVKIGIIRDAAFGFYYPDDLTSLENNGAELVTINALTDSTLPDIDGLFVGGGFPEAHLQQLNQNQSLRKAIKNTIENGLPTYAECGGLMYLSRSIQWNEAQTEMVGAIPADCKMHKRPQGRGYVQLQETKNAIWPDKMADNIIPAHEFHYSSLYNIDPNLKYAYNVKRGTGINGKNDGLIYKNLLANYTHLRDTSQHHWTHRFVQFVSQTKQNT